MDDMFLGLIQRLQATAPDSANFTVPVEYDAEKHAQMRAAAANADRGDLIGYDCPDCRNKGTIFAADGDRLVARRCRCMDIRENLKRLEQSGMRELIERSSFENFKEYQPWQTAAKQKVQEYVTRKSGWLLIAGRSGAGKTHLCAAACGALINAGLQGAFCKWRRFVSEAWTAKSNGSFAEYVAPFRTAPLLFIDDFLKTGGNVRPSDAELQLAVELIEDRYDDSKLLTIISSELCPDRLLQLDEALAGRIAERTRGAYVDLFGADNYRLQQRDAGRQ